MSGPLSDKWRVLAEIENPALTDAVAAKLAAVGAQEFVALPINKGSAGIDTAYATAETNRLSFSGGGSKTTINEQSTTVAYGFGATCWDPATGLPPWHTMMIASGFKLTVNNVGVETRYVLDPEADATAIIAAAPATFYQYERFLSPSNQQQLITSVGTKGSLDFSAGVVGELMGNFAGMGIFQEEWTQAALFLDSLGIPLLLKDGVTPVTASPITIDCDALDSEVPSCGVLHEVDGLVYPFSSWSLNTNIAVSMIDIMNGCPTAAAICAQRDGSVTGEFELHSTDSAAAYNDWRAKFPVGTLVDYSTTFFGPGCRIEFALPQVQLLPKSSRNIGKPTTWVIPWKTVADCDNALNELEIIITPNP